MHHQTGLYKAMRHANALYYGGEATSNEVVTRKVIVDVIQKCCLVNHLNQELTDWENSLCHQHVS